jgi:GTPase
MIEIKSPVLSERALLVGVLWPGMNTTLALEYLDELEMLAQTAGATVVGREVAKRQRPDPATLVGKGKVEELRLLADEANADLVIFDDDLSPAQTRNLEKVIERRVIDRPALILDIFARRARTAEARTQVELAQLRYLLPRLTRAWTHLERQQGGIGLRGPGETQIETDRRLIRTRIGKLEEELLHIDRVRTTQRSGRDNLFRMALVGYTNVGKSTIMNVLTDAGVFEENLLFATLDSTTRILALSPKRKALLTDTVGFIRKLPLTLIASFRSTLAEIREADCILHIIDLSSPAWREQMIEVNRILKDMQVHSHSLRLIFNKVDLLEDEAVLRNAAKEYPDSVFVSARTGKGVPDLLNKLNEVLSSDMVEITAKISTKDGQLLAELYRVADILDEQVDENFMVLRLRLSKLDADRLKLPSKAL